VSPRPFEHDDLLIALGQAVRAIRVEKGMTQEELADGAGVDFTYISVIERGRRNITLGTFSRISRALDTTPSGLLRKAEELESQS
jgi:transcriptional regulator with XRE-family HTH domain